ncbi:MAG: amino acid permease [Gemmatimonadetes bacterium]|nr:amino acid permease [Gemmatimonadota bacterium]
MTAPPARAVLARQFGFASATLLVVGGIIGSGIFFTPAEVARALGGGPAILGTWAAGGVVALAGALTYAELGAMMPDAGGAYAYIRAAFGRLPAFLCGWMILAMIASGAIAAVAMSFAGYAERHVPLGAVGGRLGLAALTIAALTAINVLGVRPGVWFQNTLTVVKSGALFGLIGLGLALWNAAPGATATAAIAAAPPAPAPLPPLRGIATAFVAVLFTIGGWQQMNMVAGEIREPQRTIPRALATGIGIVIAIYLGANVVYLHALGRDGLAGSAAVAADTATRLVGVRGAPAITLAAMVSILGFTGVALITNARVLFALGEDGAFLRAAARVHPRWGSPHVALLLLGGWALVLLLLTRGEFGQLLSGVVFADWIFFGMGAASVFVLRRTRPEAVRPYRVPGYPVLPAFFVLAALVGVVSAFLASPDTSLFGSALLGLGTVVHLVASRRQAARERRVS